MQAHQGQMEEQSFLFMYNTGNKQWQIISRFPTTHFTIFFFWYVRMLYIRTATLCIKNKEETHKIQEEENREKTKKENQPTN